MHLHQMLLVMRFTTILLLAACLQVSARTDAQTVSLNVNSEPLAKVFTAIEQQTGYVFFYDARLIRSAKPVTVSVRNEPLDKTLQQVLKDQPLDYAIENKTINIFKKEPARNEAPTILTAPIPPAGIDIHGRIVNEEGNPVEGVSVKIKGTTRGTVTNSNGEFSLAAVDENATLIFTSTNIETFETKIKGKTDISLIAKTKVSSMQEVVVSKGYYNVKQRDNTGNVSVVKAEDIAKQPVSDPVYAMQGRVPGLYIQQPNGIPGANPVVRLRGRNSIANGNNPLYIIDGIPFPSTSITSANTPSGALGSSINNGGVSPFSNLNPSDIESIEILKDADATAIYGSRGANGVILITTKKGKAGKTAINFNVEEGISKVGHKMAWMNTQQYLAMRRQAYLNDGLLIPDIKTTPSSTDYDINGVWDQNRYTDWQKLMIGNTAQFTNAQTSISGGNNNTQFLVGGGYIRQTTVFPGDYSDKKATAHFSLNHSSENQRFHALFSALFSNDINLLPKADFTGSARLVPNAPPLYNADGTLNWAPTTSGVSSFQNPMAEAQKSAKSVGSTLVGASVLSYDILPGLQIKATVGYNKMTMTQTNLQPATAFFGPPVANNRRNDYANSNSVNWSIEPQINFHRKISEGTMDILIGMTQQQNTTNSTSNYAYGFSGDPLISNPMFAATAALLAYDESNYRYAKLYGRVSYNWAQKYLINLTASRDGSSRFGPGKQFANFGAAGVGWIFSKEKFSSHIPWLSFGKLRASYGVTGNDQISNYQYLSTYSAYLQTYQNTNTIYPTSLANPEYRWELNYKLETGIELGLFNDRIFLSASYYRNRTGNQLVGEPLPTTTGFNTVIGNLPAVIQNTGIELLLTTTNISSKSFNWTTSFNITVPRNKLVSFPNLATNPTYRTVYQEGKSIFINPRYHFLGIDPQTGVYTFQDVNGDGQLTTTDNQFIKEIAQQYYGGLQNSLSYKNFQLDIFFQFVKQTGNNYLTAFALPGYFDQTQNMPTSFQNAWKAPGDHALIEKYSTVGGSAYAAISNYYMSDATITDASFIRLKNVQLLYALPQIVTNKLRVKMAKIFLQVQNLATVTSYQGFDPESQSISALPPLRTIVAGLNVTF